MSLPLTVDSVRRRYGRTGLGKKEEKNTVHKEHKANVHRCFNSDHVLVHLPISLCYCGDSSIPLVTAVRW